MNGFKLDVARWSPLGKLGLWFGSTLLLATAIQVIAWCIAWNLNVLSNQGGGRGILLGCAVATLLAMMAHDQRSLADYGILIGDTWKRTYFGAAALGGGVVVAMMAIFWAMGWQRLGGESVSASRWFKAVSSFVESPMAAATQQLIFSGYLLTMLRERYSRWTATAIAALLFAVLGKLSDPAALLRPETQQVVLGLFLVAMLLGSLRLWTGTIVFPAGLLAGILCSRRVLDKLLVFQVDMADPWAAWFLPQRDLRCSPLSWGLLAAATAFVMWRVARDGEPELAVDGAALAADFKSKFPFSNTSSLAPLDVWLGRMADAKFAIGLQYWPRMAAILVLSAGNTLLTLPERLILPWLLRRRKVRQPVFIVGVHRSGTTHLHNLLSQDPQFTAPTTHHIMNPAGCVFSGWLVSPVLGMFLPYERPMDSVRFSLFSPQEDEFGVSGSSRLSPYWGMTFPQCWPLFDRYLFPQKLEAAERAKWRACYDYFLKQVTFWSGQRPLLKNPCNTGRVAELREMYPDAKFIHIHRHPDAVFRSNMHLANEGHVTFQVQDQRPDEASYQQRFLANYQAMEEAFYEGARGLPATSRAEVRFEDLERDPVGEITRVYRELELSGSAEFSRRLSAYLQGLDGYSKNAYRPLDAATTARIDAHLGGLMSKWGYQRQGDQRAA